MGYTRVCLQLHSALNLVFLSQIFKNILKLSYVVDFDNVNDNEQQFSIFLSHGTCKLITKIFF